MADDAPAHQDSLTDEPTGLPGPFPVGRYAIELKGFLKGRARVRLIGEITGLSMRAKAVYFELRDAQGAMSCSMWRNDFDALGLPDGTLRDGVEVVVGGGLDYYPGSATASPSFSFRCSELRVAGEGDLLAQLAKLRKRLQAEGLFEPQKALSLPVLPRALGVITGRDSAARSDVLAGLARRSWRGTVVFAYPPMQDRNAAPKIGRALQDLAARPEIEAIVVARGGGSLADLWAFCDETLCRTVALLRVPVISAVGHEVDKTLIDDVAKTACSTPTHAAQVAVAVDVAVARSDLRANTATMVRCGGASVGGRVDRLAGIGRTLARHLSAQESKLHQLIREIRAAGRRAIEIRSTDLLVRGTVVARKAGAGGVFAGGERARLERGAGALRRHGRDSATSRAAVIGRLAGTLAAHEPDRVLERGYALVSDRAGSLLTSAAAARERGEVRIRFADGELDAEVSGDGDGNDG